MARRVRRFLPYPYAPSGVAMQVHACTLETVIGDSGRSAATSRRVLTDFDESRRLVELDNERWESARIAVELAVSAQVLDTVLPADERAAPPAELLVAIRCADTRLRRGVAVTRAPVVADRPYRAELVLQRSDCFGTVELLPYLVRASDGAAAAGATDHAWRRGTRLASARPWELRVDRKREVRGEYLDIRRARFAEDEALRPFADTLYRLELSAGAAPVLWLNADHESIDQILAGRAPAGLRAALREVFFDQIAHAVWSRLFLAAAAALADHAAEESDAVPGEGGAGRGDPADGQSGGDIATWQQGVLDQLLPEVYSDERDEPARRLRLVRDLKLDLAQLLERVDAALQRRNLLVEHMTRLISRSVGR